ncbi:LRR and NB-ARC domains-containing disease resistance protein [Prunus dulcis]|uniref:LRR and NB-ARC domains-containing disease resistance protein n=1 Tax=Prunus dulcis TaxID=3755 RepID=A0A4Y1S2A8_PRUDU|nr:LRR and NB-ARC domains-containing disease resistance protein [Prunus dulcis]
MSEGGHDGCKIIATTRSQKIPFMMDFPKMMIASVCSSTGHLDVEKKRSIQILHGLERRLSKKLEVCHCGLWELDESQHKVFPALMLSLPPHLRQCFAFCSLFPKKYEFNKHKLIHLWMAEGFIPKERSKRPEDIGDEYFSKLVWISFLQEVRLHEGKEYVVLEQGRPQNWSPAEIRHSFVVYRYGARITIPKTLYEAKHLRTLLLIEDSGRLDNGDKIYSSFEYLRVLDLNHCDLVDMPNSLVDLICLRYLDLSYTLITQLPISIRP